MTVGYRLTPSARQGLERIVQEVEQRFGTVVAERVLDQAERALHRLASNPRIGHRREDLTHDEHVRFWNVGPTLIAYRRGSTGIEILLIERGELDWKNELLRYLRHRPSRLRSWRRG